MARRDVPGGVEITGKHLEKEALTSALEQDLTETEFEEFTGKTKAEARMLLDDLDV